MGKVGVLRQKYEPTGLDMFICDDKTRELLTSDIFDSDIHNSRCILIDGNNGCGKKTCAKMFAREFLGVHKPKVNTDEISFNLSAYEVYNSDTTHAVDMINGVIEVNGVDLYDGEKIDDIIRILQSTVRGGKVIIINDMHMTSVRIQKYLVDIIDKVYSDILFIFCTTDLSMLTRDLIYHCGIRVSLSKFTFTQLSTLLKDICIKERVAYDNRGIGLVVSKSGVSVGRAIDLLEEMIIKYNDMRYSIISKK